METKKSIKSRKITNELLWKMVKRAKEIKFEKETKKIKKESKRLGEIVYNHMYSPYLETMKDLPAEAFKERNDINIKIPGEYTRNLLLSKLRPVFYIEQWSIEKHWPENTKLEKQINKLYELERGLSDKSYEYEIKARELLQNAGTTKVLFELMPEAEKWLPEVTNCSDIPVADTVAELRKL